MSFELGCAVQTFARGPGRDGTPAGFTLTTVGERRRVRTVDGFDLRLEHGLDAVASADLVVVPGRHPHDQPPSQPVIDALQEAHRRGATVLSICIGAWVLAYAGLLDGRPATTHWDYCEELAAAFPTIDVHPDRLYVDDGDILTSAGLAAGLDLCLHVVRRERGAAAAAEVARWNVIAPHREGGQAQFIPSPVPHSSETGLAATLDWALEHLAEQLPLERLADHANVSQRTLHRRFAEELGTTPKRWLLEQRVARARVLLETTELPIEHVAEQAGFPSTASLREQLRRHAATTPSAYRNAFNG